jgi:hypothetical protein
MFILQSKLNQGEKGVRWKAKKKIQSLFFIKQKERFVKHNFIRNKVRPITNILLLSQIAIKVLQRINHHTHPRPTHGGNTRICRLRIC